MRPLQSVVSIAVWLAVITSVADARSPTLPQEVEGLLRVVSITGHESLAVQYIRQRLHEVPFAEDALGNLTVTLGSGGPRRLFACMLDEPGYVVSRIQEDGYLRLSRVGSDPGSTLWDQSHEGQPVLVVTERGLIPGAIGVTSMHLAPEHTNTDRLFSVDQAYVDVGVETVAEVSDLGIRLLDPVALTRRVVQFPGGLLAAPSARAKAGCMAMAHVMRRIARSPTRGTVVFAWTVLGRMGRRGLERVAQHHGPFEEVVLLSDAFGWRYADGQWARASLPAPGSGLLAAGEFAVTLPQTMVAPHVEPSASLFRGDPNWGSARVGYLGLPAGYPDTPIELIDLGDVARLVDAFVIAAGGKPAEPEHAPPLPALQAPFEEQTGHEEMVQVLGALTSRYGVSGAEAPVRDQIRELLPAWAQPRTDTTGNLLVTFGRGAEHVVFVAHMDEVGFQVVSIGEDGRLLVRPRGGLYASLWEAQAALVHTARGAVPAVFEPRPDWHTTTHRVPPGSLTVFVGVTSRRAAEALGIQTSQTVTMPKRMLRLGKHRVLARSLDDRVGCTALLLALRRLEGQALRRRLTFAWVVEEEVGLGGSRALAATLPDVTRVYPVDTFVSSDAPLESRRFAFAPLGQGAVIRAMDSGNIVPRRIIDELRALAQSNGIPLQYGMTGGWTDGTPFLANGVVNVPLSWPGRYSHSPVEVADLRDIEALVRLITAIAMQ